MLGEEVHEGDIGATTEYTYEPESDYEEEEEVKPMYKPAPVEEDQIPLGKQFPNATVPEPVKPPTPVEETPVAPTAPAAETPEPVSEKPKQNGAVEGFQLVQATGLTDTSTPAPKGSEIPSFATPQPVFNTPLPHSAAQPPKPVQNAPMPAEANSFSSPLEDNSKSKQFTARTDFMIAEFFSRQVARLTKGAPEALDRSYRVFQQRFKEKLGAQWAHITSQPEVEEAIKHVQDMYDYFESLEKLVIRQKTGLAKVNDVETELSLWYKKEGIQEPAGSIRENMLYLSESYMSVCKERTLLIQAYDHYAAFLETFRKKAIADALATMKLQHTSRLELDAYGSKLGQLEEKKLKTFARSPGTVETSSLEKELVATRATFQQAKSKYQQMSTQLIDKAGLLDLKKGVDFAAHIAKIREVHDSFNRGRVGTVTIPEEDEIVDEYMQSHGVPNPEKN